MVPLVKMVLKEQLVKKVKLEKRVKMVNMV